MLIKQYDEIMALKDALEVTLKEVRADESGQLVLGTSNNAAKTQEYEKECFLVGEIRKEKEFVRSAEPLNRYLTVRPIQNNIVRSEVLTLFAPVDKSCLSQRPQRSAFDYSFGR